MEQKSKPCRRGMPIGVRLAGSILLCILLLLVFNWLLNNFAMVSYYQGQKQHTLEQEFQALNESATEGSAWEERLDDLGDSQNISAVIWNQDGVIYDYRPYNERVAWPVDYGEVDMQPGEYRIEINAGSQVKDIWLKNADGQTDMTQPSQTKTSDAQFIKLVGRLSDGNSVLLKTPIAAIEESVDITNQFLLISGAVTLVLGLLVVWGLSRSFTRPIRELSHIAENVAHLDFSERYTRRGNDELADLGHSINIMSDELKSTICDLKNTNARLATDVEQKTKQNQAHQAFIANVSHELKTPIALIQTYAEGLQEDIAADAGNREFYCSIIEDEAQKMSQLIKRMTMLMQLEAGGEQLVIERFDISELLRNLMLKNQVLADEKHVRMLLPDNQPVYVWADDYLIENVLSNFLSNAIHHVSQNGVISGSIVPVEEGRVRISVFNTGDYIPREELPKIWESFYKVDKARTREYGGSGIGLSVVTAIMKAHRMPYGVLNRESPYGRGVEFYIELQTK